MTSVPQALIGCLVMEQLCQAPWAARHGMAWQGRCCRSPQPAQQPGAAAQEKTSVQETKSHVHLPINPSSFPQLAPSAQPASEQELSVTPVFAVTGTKAGPGGRGTPGTGVHSRDQEERQPNPKSYHIHHAPCFLWQRGRHSSSPLGAEASPSSPGSPHVSDHGRRLFFFLSAWGRGCSPAPEADTCATQLSPGTLQREDGLHPPAAMVVPLSPSAPRRDAR